MKINSSLTRSIAVLGAAAVTIGLSSCAAETPAGSDELVEASFQLGWLPNVESMPMLVADEKGYYEEEGVDLTIEPGGPQVVADAQIVSGNVLMGALTSESLANAVEAGAPLVAVGAIYQTSPSAVVVLADSGITEPKDLEGKRLGVYETDARTYGPFFALTGVDYDKVNMVTGATDPASLVSGEVDAITGAVANQPVAIRAQGIEVNEIRLGDYGFNRWSNLLVVREDSLEDESKRAAIAGMLKATQRGLADAVADPAGAAQVVVDVFGEQLGLELESQTASAEVWAELASASTQEAGLLVVTDEGVQSQQDFFDAIGLDVQAADLFDVDFSVDTLDAN
ncbi:ABC transporter substrate-binding protein [Microbacterium sp.]|uniref:ABC transporter substrate-binding protein n=1 Tax=Microbacterium sp. TaxID=51671 RepID=UPI002636135C|nr:ABC transporter substrate-binding protein [Microbacterium sp.]